MSITYTRNIEQQKNIFEEVELLVNNIINKDDNKNGGSYESYHLLFKGLRAKLDNEGYETELMLVETGRCIGLTLYETLKSDDINKFIENISNFWESNNFGKVKIEFGDIITIEVWDCIECGSLPNTGRTMCFLDIGIIESFMSKYLKKEVEVVETECFTLGDDSCVFKVTY